MSKIFGGSRSRSNQQSTSQQTSASNSQQASFNRSFGQVGDNVAPAAFGAYNDATGAIASELSGGFEGYKNTRDFDFMRLLGLNRTAGQGSGRGVFQSGETLRSLSDYDNAIHNQYYQDYMQNLFQQAQTGLGGIGQYVTSGGTSTGQSSSNSSGTSQSTGSSESRSTGGAGGFLGGVGSILATSDRRLKKNIQEIGVLDSGLPVYSFDYIWEGNNSGNVGVMAQDVIKIKPEALGEPIDGFMAVDYSKLGE